MKLRIILSLLIILALISSCAKSQLTASAIKDLPIEKKLEVEAKITSADACMNVECGSNSRCIEGDCVCNEGYKKCNGECILSKDCCTEDDCESGESCRNHACVPDFCKVNEVFDAAKQECACDKDSKYCALQKKCIPKKNCCLVSDCQSDYRCAPTSNFAVLCITGGNKQCKSVHPDRKEPFFLQGVRYEVQVNNFLQDGGIDLDVNGINHRFAADAVESIGDNVNIYVDEIEYVGGHCKSD